jgi:RNA polymerase sigma factor (TIGR02999 family)
MTDVTRILSQINEGDSTAANQLLPLVYDELRRLAGQKMQQERPGQTLQATALVHEAFIRLVNPDVPKDWEGRGHFFAAAAEAMRKILIDKARKKQRIKHGGDRKRIDLNSAIASSSMTVDDLLTIDEALEDFAAHAPDKANLVKLRFYAGMTISEAAEALGVSRATAERHWTYAKCWLFARLEDLAGS